MLTAEASRGDKGHLVHHAQRGTSEERIVVVGCVWEYCFENAGFGLRNALSLVHYSLLKNFQNAFGCPLWKEGSHLALFTAPIGLVQWQTLYRPATTP